VFFKLKNKTCSISSLKIFRNTKNMVIISCQNKLSDKEERQLVTTISDESQVKEVFINEGRGNSPSHLKFFLLVFSKLKEDIK